MNYEFQNSKIPRFKYLNCEIFKLIFMKTSIFRNSFAVLLLPFAVSPLSAQNGIVISNFSANVGTGGAATTLTFDVSWDKSVANISVTAINGIRTDYFCIVTNSATAHGFVSDICGAECIESTDCPSCCWNGSGWVDCKITTSVYPFNSNTINTRVQWIGNDQETHFSGARSDRNGRANTNAITASSTYSAMQICKNLGSGWYLPAYEELLNMSQG
jgi:hypothetical protein